MDGVCLVSMLESFVSVIIRLAIIMRWFGESFWGSEMIVIALLTNVLSLVFCSCKLIIEASPDEDYFHMFILLGWYLAMFSFGFGVAHDRLSSG